MGGLDEVIATLASGVGLSDTMLALRIPEIARALPDIRIVVMRRDLRDVRASMAKIGYPMPGRFLDELEEALRRAHRLPNAIRVRFGNLSQKYYCRWIFEHCLGEPMPDEWWDLWRGVNVQSVPQSVIQAAQDNYTGVRALYGV